MKPQCVRSTSVNGGASRGAGRAPPGPRRHPPVARLLVGVDLGRVADAQAVEGGDGEVEKAKRDDVALQKHGPA